VEIAATPVMEPDADLEDAVVQTAYRRVGVPPEELERLVLREELARVELFDPSEELGRGRLGATSTG